MTGPTDAEDERPEQLLTESVPSPDIRLPLATVECAQRADWVAQATETGGVPLAALGPVQPRTRR